MTSSSALPVFELPAEGSSRFVTLRREQPASSWSESLGPVPGLVRFVAIRRQNVCWCAPRFGRGGECVPEETQLLLGELDDGTCCALTPLVADGFRAVLAGQAGGGLVVSVQAGDPEVRADQVLALHVARGRDPYALLRRGAGEIAEKLGTVRLLEAKTVPDFVNGLGFCSWNAFYNKVTQEKLSGALRNFRAEGVQVSFVIVDAGWQPDSEDMLTGFEADAAKFPNGVRGLADALKKDGGISHLLLWMTYNGYWRGLHPEKMATYKPRLRTLETTNTLPVAQEDVATVGETFLPEHVNCRGVASPEPDFLRFYSDYFDFLRKQGVDGVKIDAMTWIEAFGEGKGGRVAAMGDLLNGVESQSLRHWGGSYLACSSCSNDFLLQTLTTALVRTSADYYPDKPATHGVHLVNNAFVGLWMGEYCLPDWDMFQSGHAAGAFHAAARAISGGPVYVADEVGRSDFALLRRLAFADGSVPRCRSYARPCRDLLFCDPAHENLPLKLFNHNAENCVLGLFNCRWNGGDKDDSAAQAAGAQASGALTSDAQAAGAQMSAAFTPADAQGNFGEAVAAWSDREQTLRLLGPDETTTLELPQLGFEIVTLCAVRHGFAPVGLIGMLNPGGTVSDWCAEPGRHRLHTRGGGVFTAYAAREPVKILFGGNQVNFTYAADAGRLDIQLDASDKAAGLEVFLT